MSTNIASKSEDAELENILLQIFVESGASSSISAENLIVLTDDEVSISKIVQYVQDQLPACPIEHMLELCKCLIIALTNDRLNILQFKEAVKCWIVKVRQMQDDNNNTQKEFYKDTNNLKMDSMKAERDKDITEVELRMRVRKFDEENLILREELVRAEELIANLERQRNNLENQLERYIQKCQQLEKDNDEQREELHDVLNKEKACVLAFQKSTKDYNILLKQLESAEIEIQAIPSLKEDLKKITKEKKNCIKHITKLQEELDKKEEECKTLKSVMSDLQDTNNSMKEIFEYTILNLREKNRQLKDENMELQSWSALNEEKSFSPIPNMDGYCPHSTPYKLQNMSLENSLFAELRASGFTAECSRSLWVQELEQELNQYDIVIPTILEQLQKVIENFIAISNSTNIPQFDPPHTEDAKVNNLEILKHKVAFLLNMVSDEVASRRNTTDSSTQLRADSDGNKNSNLFGVTSFQALLTHTHQCLKPEEDLRSLAIQRASDNKDDPFLKIICAKESVQNRNITEVIDPIIEELDKIIQHTIDLPSYQTCADLSFDDSRNKSIHTLSSKLSPLSSLSTKSAEQSSNYQSPRTNFLDISFAQGDGLTEENCCEKIIKSVLESDISIQENPSYPKENRSNEMPKVLTALQMDSKELSIAEEANDKSFKIPETSSSPITSPRRKISVYSRSFNVVEMQDSCENEQRSNLEVKQPLNSSSAQEEEEVDSDENVAANYMDDQNSVFKYQFAHYRDTNNDSDSSNSCSPHKQSENNFLDDEPVVQSANRKIYLAPTRLKFAQEIQNKSSETAEVSDKSNVKDSASSDSKLCESDKSFSIVASDEHRKDDNISVHSSSTFVIDKYDTDSVIFNSNSCSVNEQFPQRHMTSVDLTPHNQTDSAKIASLDGPHSQTSMQKVLDSDQLRVERSVNSQMSNREDTSLGSDSECEPTESSDRYVNVKKVTTVVNEANSAVSFIGSVSSTKVPCENAVQNDGKAHDRNLFKAKQKRRQQSLIVRKAFSEDETSSRRVCRCKQSGHRDIPLIQTDNQCRAFPSLTDIRLQESGIAVLSNTKATNKENLNELELQKRYTAFSLCLCTDRITLSQRMELSLRQRDQSERNISNEVLKMQQNIQELAPLCTDRESMEKVERVRHQLDMVARCVHKMSCTAETLGAVHQEYRVSRAILLADQYLHLLQSRCEKLTSNIVETKRILIENNIVVEENSNELADDLPRIRYRSGTPANNRMMMARRRASVATMSRPMGSAQDVIKDTARQRNSVSGRVTLRRPSLSYESPKWEIERLDRTDSTSSIGELRNIFEHVESRRNSKEENNNMLRLSQSSSQNIINLAIVDNEIWTNPNQTTCPEFLSIEESTDRDCTPCTRWSRSFRRGAVLSWHVMLWSILIFFLGFYVNHVISTMNICNINDPLNHWSIKGILRRYGQTRNVASHPI